MVGFEAIWNTARADLVVATETGEQDIFLWEHSSRVARNAWQIAMLPEVRGQSPDEVAVVAAGLYHDASWIMQYRDGEIDRTEILCRPTPKAQRQRGAELLERSLGELVPEESLRRAAATIRELGDREPTLIETRIITDAENLDEFGMLAFCPGIVRSAHEGKGVQAAIDTWKRKKEYQFWTARLTDSFHLDAVRKLAEQRLAKYERAMKELEEHHTGADIIQAGGGKDARPAPAKPTL